MHKKGHIKKTRKTKHRGGFYGAAGPIPGTVNSMQWNTGTEVAPPKYAGGKRRKSTRKTKRKTRGGNRFGAVSASFQGSGTNGMANYVPISTKGGVATHGAFNDNGARPGSSFP